MNEFDENTPSEVLPRLFLTNHTTATNLKWLQQNNVKLIVNVSKDLPFSSNAPHLATTPNTLMLRVYIDDIYTSDVAVRTFEQNSMSLHLDHVVDFIHIILKDPNSAVVVHCLHGIQRSAAIIVGYLLKYGRSEIKNTVPAQLYTYQSYLDKAIQYVINKRPKAFVGGKYINFADSMKKYDKILFDSGTPSAFNPL